MIKDARKGLTTKQAKDYLKIFGKNEIETEERFSVLALFLSQFPTLINAILTLAAIFSLIIGNLLDGIFIFAILLLNALFGFIQEYKAEKSLEKLKDFIAPKSRVIRNEKEMQVLTLELVPGDLVVLSEGDRIPADGKIQNCQHLEIDESILTGESLPVEKEQNDFVFSGTLVAKGKGHFLIEKTGMNTRFGEIAKSLASIEAEKTPLQVRLDALGKMLSLAAILISLLLVPLGLAQGKTLFPLILLSASIAVAAIPESLPAVITIALGIGTNRMAKQGAIVRKMQAIETLGAVQVILIDKTGTLTQNKMRVKKVFTKDKNRLADLTLACVLGNTASLIKRADGGEQDWEVLGDKTDGALLLWVKSQNLDPETLKKEGEIIDEYVFDPATKTITTLWESKGLKHVFVRGSPEIILLKSRLNSKEKEKITALFREYAQEGLRVIGFAKKVEGHDGAKREHLETNLEFLGLVGIYDPPRKEAKQSLKEARRAGIKTVMVTGDNELTAQTIAKETGLIEKGEDILTGEVLNKLSDEELKKIIPKTAIFARTSPADKLRLVRLFKELGFTVAVTGDGVNDAPALRQADAGVAMGEGGTDVAKEASDIVLTNNNFSVLIKAIEEGRTIYNNLLKAITYLLSGNLSELSLVLFAAVLGMPNPLLPTQILWINLITDGLPALALASDVKDPKVISEQPHSPKTPFLSGFRQVFILLVGLTMGGSLLLTFSLLLKTSSETFARTFIFNALISLHLLMAFAIRGKSIFRLNKFLLLSLVITFILQFIITTTPFFQKIFHLGF